MRGRTEEQPRKRDGEGRMDGWRSQVMKVSEGKQK